MSRWLFVPLLIGRLEMQRLSCPLVVFLSSLVGEMESKEREREEN